MCEMPINIPVFPKAIGIAASVVVNDLQVFDRHFLQLVFSPFSLGISLGLDVLRLLSRGRDSCPQSALSRGARTTFIRFVSCLLSQELARWHLRYSTGPTSLAVLNVTVSAFGGEPDSCDARPVVAASPEDGCSPLYNDPQVKSSVTR